MTAIEIEKLIRKTPKSDDAKGDLAFQGLAIIAKYMNPLEQTIIWGVIDEGDYDIVYGPHVSHLENASKEDIIRLAQLGWETDQDGTIFCRID